MLAFAVFLSSLALLGCALALRTLGRSSRPRTRAPEAARIDQDLLPDTGPRAIDGLASFYGYQMRAGRVDRS